MDDLDRLRSAAASPYLRGQGIEIGAGGRPLHLDATVRYVDIYPRETVEAQYPSPVSEIPPTDLVEDGFTLPSIQAGSLDFIVACHVLEHSENLLGTLAVHLDRIRPDGHLFYILPDRDRTQDRQRAVTTFAHLISDEVDGGQRSRPDHLAECRGLYPIDQDIRLAHFHCWNPPSLLETLVLVRGRFCDQFTVECFAALPGWPEILFVLRRA